MPSSQYTGGPQNLYAGVNGYPLFISGGYPGKIEDPEARERSIRGQECYHCLEIGLKNFKCEKFRAREKEQQKCRLLML